jgi:FtsH-binding integral membrane protein
MRIRLKPIMRVITVFAVKRYDNKRQLIVLITVVTVLLLFILFGYSSVFALYLYGHPFCLDAFNVGSLLLVQAFTVFLMSLLIMFCKKKSNDTYILPLLGSLALIIDLIIFSIAKRIWLLYIGNVFVVIISVIVFCCFLFHSLSCLHRKPVLYYTTYTPNETYQTGRGERICCCIHRRRHCRNDWTSGTGRCGQWYL